MRSSYEARTQEVHRKCIGNSWESLGISQECPENFTGIPQGFHRAFIGRLQEAQREFIESSYIGSSQEVHTQEFHRNFRGISQALHRMFIGFSSKFHRRTYIHTCSDMLKAVRVLCWDNFMPSCLLECLDYYVVWKEWPPRLCVGTLCGEFV